MTDYFPMFTSTYTGLVKINTSPNVHTRLSRGSKYYMYLPDTDETLYLECSFVAIRAADMKILRHVKGYEVMTEDLNHTFGYQFDNYDSINFASFKYREKCELYATEEIYLPRKPLDAIFAGVFEEI